MSLKEVEQKIEAVKEKLELDTQIKERLKEIEEEDKYLRRRVTALQRIVEKEYEDILNLERANLNALFSRILGNYEEQMDQEKQEYLEACLNYSTLLREKELIEFEEKLLNDKSIDRDSCQVELERLFLKKEGLLKSQNNSISKRLLDFDREIGKLKLRIYHINKAQQFGEICQIQIKEILQELKQVSSWGFRELSGSTMKSKQKRQRFVETALQKAVETQRYLNQYSTKIEKIFPENKPTFQLDQFKIFVQTLVHHLVSDWIVERRIKMAFQGLDITMDQLTLYLYNLSHEKSHCQGQIEKLENEKRLYVEHL